MLRKKLKLDPVKPVENDLLDAQAENKVEENIDENKQEDSNLNISKNINEPSPVMAAPQMLRILKSLSESLQRLSFSSGIYVYNPLEYAFDPHMEYINKYCNSKKSVLFIGMNPGPNGMCQTGVPFGEVKAVKEFLGIDKPVRKPVRECPKKQVLGFDCRISEPSGQRLWGYVQQLCKTPENFFKNAFVYNYCPLAFLRDNGTNVTPSELKGSDLVKKQQMEERCDKALLEIIQLLEVAEVVGIGRYAEEQAKKVLSVTDLSNTVRVHYLKHPSPRVPNNQNWAQEAEKFLKSTGLIKFFAEC